MLSAHASQAHDKGLSNTAYSNASSAVSHYLQLKNRDPQYLLRLTAKAYNQAHPTKPRTDDIPDIHAIFDVVASWKAEDEKTLRLKATALFILLGSKRPSDVVRTWHHPRCLCFEWRTLDTPQWAREHTGEAATILTSLGLLPRRNRKDRDFVVMRFRPYKPKVSRQSNRLYGRWVDLVENRFNFNLCPVLAIAKYLRSSRPIPTNICTELRYAKDSIVDELLDTHGRNPVTATPLFLTLEKRSTKQKKGLQSSTIASLMKHHILQPLDLKDHVPYVLRATSCSYKIAYGVDVTTVRAAMDCTSEQTFLRHYYRGVMTPIAAQRLFDARQFHDLTLTRAHALSKGSLPPLSTTDSRAHANTGNDAAIANALKVSVVQRSRLRRRRS